MKTVLATLLLAASAAACADASAPVAVQGAWARPIVPGQDSTGAYMTLTARAANHAVDLLKRREL